jgi:lysophospholipase L1-like esterase
VKARSVLFVAVLGALVAGACTPAKPLPPPDTYVALGDSYTAGPLIPNQVSFDCARSDHNYPNLLAPSTGLPKFRDNSCSGATTEDMYQPHSFADFGNPNPPQFTGLDVMTGLVTITIGGNDIGFTSIAEQCFMEFIVGSCRNTFAPPGGPDEISQRIAATAPKVDAVLDGIRALAPRAAIVVINYLPIFAEDGDLALTTCPVTMPVNADDIAYLRDKQKELNGMLEAQAAANGALFVDAYSFGLGHDACQLPTVRWVEPLVPGAVAAPIHPNADGMVAITSAILTGP